MENETQHYDNLKSFDVLLATFYYYINLLTEILLANEGFHIAPILLLHQRMINLWKMT